MVLPFGIYRHPAGRRDAVPYIRTVWDCALGSLVGGGFCGMLQSAIPYNAGFRIPPLQFACGGIFLTKTTPIRGGSGLWVGIFCFNYRF